MMTNYQTVLVVFDFPHSSVGKESTCNAEDTGLILGLGRSAREGIGYPFQFFMIKSSCAHQNTIN